MRRDLYSLQGVRVERANIIALDIEALQIARGQITTVVGDNGSGKSTLLHLLAFLLPPTSGTLSFEGETVEQTASNLYRLRKRATLVAQEPLLLKRTVRANLRYGLDRHGLPHTRVQDALERVGLSGFENRQAAELSGGERQRVAIARAIALDTDAILLDEPAANLDRGTVNVIEDLLRQLAADGRCVIMSTHNLDQARRLGDEVLALEGGRPVRRTE